MNVQGVGHVVLKVRDLDRAAAFYAGVLGLKEVGRLGDVARVELAAGDYPLRSRLDGQNAAAIGVFQAPGANALSIRDQVVAKMDNLQSRFPPGVEYRTVYDTTIFVRDSIKAVVTTLLEATLLVVLVVILFLQTWRASIIPLIAVPVSVVGTFAALHVLGFSINTLTLFGITLATGLVVDDAIVVIENIERHIEQDNIDARGAASVAMREVAGAVIATSLVLIAVFVPVSFFPGTTGAIEATSAVIARQFQPFEYVYSPFTSNRSRRFNFCRRTTQ